MFRNAHLYTGRKSFSTDDVNQSPPETDCKVTGKLPFRSLICCDVIIVSTN